MLNRVLRRVQPALPSVPRRWLAEAAAQPPPPRVADALAADHPLRFLTSPRFLTAVPPLALLVTAFGSLALFSTYFVDTRVADKLSAMIAQNAVLSTRMDGIASSITKEVDIKTAALASSITKEVDAKTAGLASSITKEVDAKTAGLAKEVDAKTAGLAKEVDAKVAGVIAAAGLKADAETMRVLKEYKVRGRR
jgi:hypothetical protein